MLQMNYSSLIFPEIQPLPQVLGDPRLRSDVLLQIQSDPSTYAIFQSFTPQEQEAFLGFCMGERRQRLSRYRRSGELYVKKVEWQIDNMGFIPYN